MLFSSNHINNLLNDGGAVIATIVSNAVQIMPAYREAGRGYNQCLPNIGKFLAIMEFGPVLDLKAIGKSGARTMSSDRAILLISDRPDRSRDLAHRLGGLCACRTIGLYEQQATAQPVAAVVTDVGFRHPADIERLRHVLSQPRGLAVPIVAILRDNSHLERVQAVAVGATFLFPADVSVSDIARCACADYSIDDPLGRAGHKLGAWRRTSSRPGFSL